MIVAVQTGNRIHTLALPQNVVGAHWVSDTSGARLVFIEAKEGAWRIEPAPGIRVRGLDGDVRPTIDLDPQKHAVLNLDGEENTSWCLVFYPDSAGFRTSQVYGFSGDAQITVGRASENVIAYANNFVSSHHARLSYTQRRWYIEDLDSSNGTFANGVRIAPGQRYTLNYGDVVRILDLTITLGCGLISCNNPKDAVKVSSFFVRYEATCLDEVTDSPEVSVKPREFFYPALRFARSRERKTFTIDAPPAPEKEEEMSLAMRIGPSLIMGLTSVLSACVFISMMAEQNTSILRAVPMIGMAVAMLTGSVLWPILNARSSRRRREKKEAARRASYSQYLSKMYSAIAAEEATQREILNENRVSVQMCLERAHALDVHLMDRTPLHADYLEVRIGQGTEPLLADIRFPDSHFTINEDEVRESVEMQAKTPRVLEGVPLAYPLIEKPILGIVGDEAFVHAFVRGIVVQLCAMVSYEDMKLMVLCDEQSRDSWAFASHLPHCFSDDRSMRYFACGIEETNELGMFMERVIDARRAESSFEARDAHPYYLIVCASEELVDRADIVHSVVSERDNLGISLIATARSINDLPKECKSVIVLEGEGAYLLDRDDPSGNRRVFTPDIMVDVASADGFAFALGRVHLDITVESLRIPSRLGFLEMLGAGSVEHLSIASQWRESNASATLACAIGQDEQGEPFLLNLHEKFHGPHGLIAGTTGSGKSEFIITYILSMAINYSPNDVAFVIIDYKGGGLARAFDNEHVHLPHLAGVITNLDGAAISRSLASIKSELKHRQALFNQARDIAGGDNVDIYDYLDLFRQGKVSEPCPHLFIVADEFAELKQQEPEFMDELISTARIGRSLGVHLILATQKPSGVVNDQIWSNSRFKVSLKVADEADSREIIKRPDAAALTQAGRFYLLVGYNEYFALGQAAYAGSRYVAHERFCATTDDSVVLISNTGRPLVSMKPKQKSLDADGRTELVAVLSLVQDCAAEQHLHARQLWLEPVPALVMVDAIAAKYARAAGGCTSREGFDIDPIVGEFDDPQNQRQGVLSLPITREGNALVYGTTDSGAEKVVYAATYAMFETFGPEHLNLYALDFGSESLRAFSPAPQMGDVICVADEEKVRRFFDFIKREIAKRRELMTKYGGSFLRYVAAGGDAPAIIVVINYLGAFLEAYPTLEDELSYLVREAGKGGIYLLASAAGPSSVRMKYRQYFRQVLAINLADTSDYAMLFGSMHGVPIPTGYARGLVRTEEGVFEFQGAHLCEDDDFAFAERFSAGEAAKYPASMAAPAVPLAPKCVEPYMLQGQTYGHYESYEVPFGLYDDVLGLACFDFSESLISRCVFQRKKSGTCFMRAFLNFAPTMPGWEISVLDISQLLGEEKPQGCAFATRSAEFASTRLLSLFSMSGEPTTPRQLVVISGVVSLFSSIPLNDANEIKALLRGLSLVKSQVRLLLIDSVVDATYNYEDWFKAHTSSRDGLWIGPGVDAQTVITTTYTRQKVAVDAKCENKGYLIEGGIPRLVHLLGIVDGGSAGEI